MGIELPLELADVAARTGVKWPEADEDKMRETAQAWRDTGEKVTRLISDADATARTALGTTEGAGADAARTHWGKYVQPDTGHLTSVAKGCHNAADQLDHAAHQVGEAKLAIVRNLVPLAQNLDVANHAAAAGHPTALLGLDTAVKGTAANIANVQSTLVTAVQPASGVVMATTQDLVNPNPGAHAGPAPSLLAPVADVVPGGQPGQQAGQQPGLLSPVTDLTQGVADTTQGAVNDLAGGGPGQQPGPLAPVAGLANDVVDTTQGAVSDVVGGGHGNQPGPLSPVADLTQDAVGATTPGQRPDLLDPGAPGQRPDLPFPGGGAGGGGQPGIPGGAGDMLPGGPPGQAFPVPGGPEPATGPIPLPYSDAPTPPSGIPIARQHDFGVQVAAAAPAVLDAPPPPAAQAPQAPPPQQAPPLQQPGIAGGAPPPPPAAGPNQPVPNQPAAPNQPVAPGAPVQRGAAPMVMATDLARPAPQAAAPAVPAAAAVGVEQKPEQDTTIAIWLVRLFPIGHLPVATGHPARQLPPPNPEFDYAPGMRFEPHDHPESYLMDDAEALHRNDIVQAEAPGANVVVDGLAVGYDSLGDQHERDWDRRFVVRPGSGRDTLDIEYAWPPGEMFPEGTTAPGDPIVLEPGTVIDRFGTPEGRVFAAADTAFDRRALPPSHLRAGYRRYQVLRPIPVWAGISAPWFNQPGGGVRYRTLYPATDLVAMGYLEQEVIGEG
ncbi:MAG: TNT domain-containing protein [Kibdelosporangium sp.]